MSHKIDPKSPRRLTLRERRKLVERDSQIKLVKLELSASLFLTGDVPVRVAESRLHLRLCVGM